MAIDKIGFGGIVVRSSENSKQKAKNADKPGSVDRAELSEEAKLLFAAEKEKKIGEIREKVKSGFYNTPEVTEKVVEGLMQDIKGSSKV
jgi:anti-sigma28 factor (negative regulator of flagellin synthesis)